MTSEAQLQHEQLVTLLTEIRDGVRELTQVLLTPLPEAAPVPCQHPLESRSDQNPRATFYQCRACGDVVDRERT